MKKLNLAILCRHMFLKKSTDHEKQGLLSVMQDDRNVPIAIDTAVTGSHHEDTISEPLIQPTSGNSSFEWRMENSSTTGDVQTEGENSQMEMPTNVTCGEIQPPSENSILDGRMENSSTTGEVQTEGENSQMEMPTDVTCGENLRKEQMQVSGILSEPNEEKVQLLHAIDILIPNQSVTSWSNDEDACRNSHSAMLQETSQGGVSNGIEQITPSEVVPLMAGSCAAVGTRIQIDESSAFDGWHGPILII